MSDCHDSYFREWLEFRLSQLKDQIMSEVTDKIAAVEKSQDEAIARVREDVAAQQAEIDDLKTKVTAPEDIAALDRIRAKNEALDPLKPAVLPESGGEPPAPAAPTTTGTGTEGGEERVGGTS